MPERIIVCGYPKSGNTWLTRLTAEIVGCPVVGFWCQPLQTEVAIEGADRHSEYQCFKAHHSIDQLRHTLNIYGNGKERIIYLYRDPRDVVVSASHFFPLSPRYTCLHNLLGALSLGSRIYERLFHSYSYKLDVLTRGLIEGTSQAAWLRTPWKAHVEGFLENKETLCLSYESLKRDPMARASEICEFLTINRSDHSLETAIHTQSFHVKKRRLEEQGIQSSGRFLRRGEVSGWSHVLPARHVAFIEHHIGTFMNELGYATGNRAERPVASAASPP